MKKYMIMIILAVLCIIGCKGKESDGGRDASTTNSEMEVGVEESETFYQRVRRSFWKTIEEIPGNVGESEIALCSRIRRLLRTQEIDYRSEKLFISQPYLIIGNEDNHEIVCFLFMDRQCVGVLAGQGAFLNEYRYLNLKKESVEFLKNELSALTELMENNIAFCVTTVQSNVKDLCIIPMDVDKRIILKKVEGENIKDEEPLFQTIKLFRVYKEYVDY